MHLVYIDDSGDNQTICFSAICFPAQDWQTALAHWNAMRKQMRDSDGIYMRKELHATEFVGGQGRIAKHFVPKGARGRLFNFVVSSIALLPNVQIFNACSVRGRHEQLFRNLLTRIDTNMRKSGSYALIFSDEGKDYNAMLRRMRRYNPVPSRYGRWPDGNPYKNIPVDFIIEDINYRDSARAPFVQAADFCAYSLHRKEKPLASKTRLGIDLAFPMLDAVLVKAANAADPHGIIRA